MKKNLSILVSVFSVILLIFLFFWHEFESEYFEIVFYSVVCIEILITVLGFMLNSIFEEKENKTDSLQDFFSFAFLRKIYIYFSKNTIKP